MSRFWIWIMWLTVWGSIQLAFFGALSVLLSRSKRTHTSVQVIEAEVKAQRPMVAFASDLLNQMAVRWGDDGADVKQELQAMVTTFKAQLAKAQHVTDNRQVHWWSRWRQFGHRG
jgi:hypothetical protein